MGLETLSLDGKSGDRMGTRMLGRTEYLVNNDQIDKNPSKFLVLCDERFERLYALQFADVSEDCSIAFRFISDPDRFILECLRGAPAAGLVDLGTLIRGKTEDMNRLFAFRCVWPVLRSRVGSDGNGEIMRVNPPLKGAFQETIAQLVEGGSAWENEGETRRQLRCNARCRARWRIPGTDGDWSRGNIQIISRGGCMIVASDPPKTGTPLEIEIRDLPGDAAVLNGEVVWSLAWEDSVDVPRCGVHFAQQSFPETLREALGNPEFATLP